MQPGVEYKGNSGTTFKIEKTGTQVDPAQFGGGKIDVAGGPKGQISVSTGVTLFIKDNALKDLYLTLNNVQKQNVRDNTGMTEAQILNGRVWPIPQVQIQYTGTSFDSLDFVQFGWLDIKETRNGLVNQLKLPPGVNLPPITGNPTLTTNPAMPSWFVDVNDPKKSIAYIKGDGLGTVSKADKSLVLLDGPSANTLANWTWAMLAGEKIAAGVTSVTVTRHFETYLVYKGQPIYRITWTSSSTLASFVNPAKLPPPVFTVEKAGSGPVNQLSKEQYDVLSNKFPTQMLIQIPKK